LRDGYLKLLAKLYEPEAYFSRFEDLFLKGQLDLDKHLRPYWKRHPLTWLKTNVINSLGAALVFWRVMRAVPEASLRREYMKRLWRVARKRPTPTAMFHVALKCAMHYHHHTMTQQMAHGRSPIYNSF